jgi:transcriptional regulator with PAS, ATPase and Fis domain
MAEPLINDTGIARLWIAADPASQRILEMARKVAATSSTLLLRGESGTGKDLLAQVIHYLSPAREEPYIKIDCASLPPEPIESELFGHERGAFTGAASQKRGRLEMAGAGAIVLDEVAALTLPMQAKILRVVEEKKFERLGGNVTLKIESRLIALTHADLEAAVRQRAFREDLYYRLNVVPIEIPPLRARRGDILPMADQMLAKLCQIHRKPSMTMSSPVRKALGSYDFPGNGRELRNILERAVLLAVGDEVLTQHLPAHLAESRPGAGIERLMTLEDMEQQYIAEVLDHTHGRKSKAAKILGISRKTLLEKRKRYQLD